MISYLNVGCGSHFVPSWTNIDFVSSHEAVRAWDLTQGIPAESESFDVVYHSHLLEHLSSPDAEALLRECYRVLKPGGVLRIVVPDLESLAKEYVSALDRATTAPDDAVTKANHEWATIHLLDQLVREQSGGAMVRFLERADLPNLDYVISRTGSIGKRCRSVAANGKVAATSWLTLRRLGRALRNPPYYVREIALRVLLGKNFEHLRVGRFRCSGEIHRWMYDRYSLTQLLVSIGFSQVATCSASTSAIPGWTNFDLDTEPDGSVYHPDSLFLEGRREKIS
jgi:predicted SAM-dependent methyltransferase